MKTNINRNVIIIIIFLAFLLGILVFWKFFLVKSQKQTSLPAPTINPTPILTLTPTATPIFFLPSPTIDIKVTPKEKIINLLPITTQNYTIEYLPKIDKFFVLIFGTPFEKYKKEIEEWFYSQGIEKLEDLDISWGSPRQGISP